VQIYGDLVFLLNFLVDFFLILGANRLSGHPPGIGRGAAAAVLGGGYAFACLLPGFRFLGGFLWRMVFLCLIAAVAFGCRWNAVRRGVIFLLLSFSLSGAVLALGSRKMGTLLLAACAVAWMCRYGLGGKIKNQRFVPVTIQWGDQTIKMTALVDTGNTLKDPVTGEQVYVAGADLAERMLSLTPQQLASPVETMASAGITGLRLIPYRSVGQPAGMLLAVRCGQVKIGSRCGPALVAFAPESIGRQEGYEMLAGGNV